VCSPTWRSCSPRSLYGVVVLVLSIVGIANSGLLILLALLAAVAR
jgi:hypothetical protein